jgi:hypothetical protein
MVGGLARACACFEGMQPPCVLISEHGCEQKCLLSGGNIMCGTGKL